MKSNDVYIVDCKHSEYYSEIFNPSDLYPEGIDVNIKSDKVIYNNFRNLLHEMKLDNKNFGTKNWNPFSDFIKEGNKVVIKPNLVTHVNGIVENGTDCLITNFSILRPIIDYTLLALNKSGNIILGDAPVQECIFSEVIKLYGLEDAINKYNSKGYNIQLKDFRKNENPMTECTEVNIGKESSLKEVDKYYKKYAITNYDLRKMHSHHHDGNHVYLIAKDVLDADVIINVPKPKAHRKAGMTACMKNLIGVNAKKEYLPHHRNGSIAFNGDEYPEKSLIKYFRSLAKNYTYTKSKILIFIYRCLGYALKVFKLNRFQEGSWYGNDTIWRTILDINRIVLYSTKNGVLMNTKQRTIFNVADMIICGEKEGPLMPSPKDVGYLVASFNQLNMDNVISDIMGFEAEKIKYIKNGYNFKKMNLSDTNTYEVYKDGKRVLPNTLNKHFIPTDGWKDYLNSAK